MRLSSNVVHSLLRRNGLLMAVCLAAVFGRSPVLSAQETPDRAADSQSAEEETAEAEENPFPGRFPAPSLDGGTEWFNTSAEISMQELRGKIVLLDFWTYCCINCIARPARPEVPRTRNTPKELVVIGVHAVQVRERKGGSENIRQRDPPLRDRTPGRQRRSEDVIARKVQHAKPGRTLVVIDPEDKYVGFLSGEGNRAVLDKIIGEDGRLSSQAKGTLDETPRSVSISNGTSVTNRERSSIPGKLLADVDSGNRLFISDCNHNRIVITFTRR